MLVHAALTYARQGWRVIPLHTPQRNGACSCKDAACEHIGKHPRFADWQRRATTNERTIHDWWRHWPTANIGIVTGAASGLFVLDSDEGGAASIAENGELPTTAKTTTGSGGAHYLFKHPGHDIPNLVKFMPGLDSRGDGGLIVAPPSLHSNGQRYAWATSRETPLAQAPAWLLDGLKRKQQPEPEQADALRANDSSSPNRRGEAYAATGFQRDIEQLRQTSSGRNSALNGLAYRAGRFIGGGHIDRAFIEQELYSAALHIKLPAAHSKGTIKRGIEAGMNQPLTIEPPRRQEPPAAAPQRAQQRPARPAPPTPEEIHASDMGNAMRFAQMHAERVRYVPQWDSWLVWDGTRWHADEIMDIQRMARTVVRGIYKEAADSEDTAWRVATAKWALKSEEHKQLRNMVTLAQSEPGITISANGINPDHFLLNCTNGTLDLRTGQIRPHDQTDLITRRVPVAYDPNATCPQWEKFLQRVLQNDEELITYVRRGIGYTLTGSVKEQCLFFAYGTGRNGKSTLFETLMRLLGDYSQKAPTELIMQKYDNGGGGASNHVARLAGMRMVVTAEIEEGKRMSEALVKDLTGDDTITARFLYKEHFSFKPTHKLWIYGNHKPEVRGTDPGIWRRIRVIPFDVQIPREEVDPHLQDKLTTELPGILAWAVRGCMEHQREGLNEPLAVKKATQEYRAEMDVLAAFFDDCCTLQKDAQVRVSDLYEGYRTWCEDNGERPLTQRRLAAKLNERGFERVRVGSKAIWYRVGIGLLDDQHRSGSDDDDSTTDPTVTSQRFSQNLPHVPPHVLSLPKTTKLDQLDQYAQAEIAEVAEPVPPTGQGEEIDAAPAATTDNDEDAAPAATAQDMIARLKARVGARPVARAITISPEYLEQLNRPQGAD